MPDNTKQWQDEAEKIAPPKQGKLNEGDVKEPAHIEPECLEPVIPLGR